MQFKLGLEMQRKADKNYFPRMAFESSLLRSCDMKPGEKYEDNMDVKIISICFNSSLPCSFAFQRVQLISKHPSPRGEWIYKEIPDECQHMECIYILLDKDGEQCGMCEELKEWIHFINISLRPGVTAETVKKRENTYSA